MLFISPKYKDSLIHWFDARLYFTKVREILVKSKISELNVNVTDDSFNFYKQY